YAATQEPWVNPVGPVAAATSPPAITAMTPTSAKPLIACHRTSEIRPGISPPPTGGLFMLIPLVGQRGGRAPWSPGSAPPSDDLIAAARRSRPRSHPQA